MFLSKPDWVVQSKLTSYGGGVWKTEWKGCLTLAGLYIRGHVCYRDF